MALHINIFGAPGAGKSTNRARLYYELKKKQYKVEEIVEYAKELTYGEDNIKLSDQVLVLGKQHHAHHVLDKKVEYIVTDSPFFMGVTYVQDDCPFKDELYKLALAMNDSYETMNFFIERNHEYQEYGRSQTEAEADEKSDEIKKFLDDNKIEYVALKSGKDFIKTALKKIKKHRKAK
jgi:broad-specificity NMP kinase